MKNEERVRELARAAVDIANAMSKHVDTLENVIGTDEHGSPVDVQEAISGAIQVLDDYAIGQMLEDEFEDEDVDKATDRYFEIVDELMEAAK